MAKVKRAGKKAAAAKKAAKAPRRAPTMSPETAFKFALTEPFNTKAEGARVPDLFSAPTEARTFRTNFTLASDSNGMIDFIAFANPVYPGFSTRGNVVSGSQFKLQTNASATVNSSVPSGVGSSLRSEFTSYRVVGWGIKLTGISSVNTTSGSVTICTVPFSGYVPHAGTVGVISQNASSLGSIGDWLSWAGLPSNSNLVTVGKLDGLRDARKVSLSSLATVPQTANSRPIDPRAYEFRYSSDTYYGYSIVSQSSTSYVVGGNAAYLDASGWLNLVIGGQGFPASTNVVEVEMVYHLEGVPALDTSTLNRGNATESPVNWSGYLAALQAAAATPAIRAVASTALASMGLGPLASILA